MTRLFNRIICFQQLCPFYQQYDITVQQSAKHLNFDILFLKTDLMYGTSFNLSLDNLYALFCIKIHISNSPPCLREQQADLMWPFFFVPKDAKCSEPYMQKKISGLNFIYKLWYVIFEKIIWSLFSLFNKLQIMVLEIDVS